MLYKQIVHKSEYPPKIKGIHWKILRNHSISQELELDDAIQCPENSFYRLVLSEHGGGASNTGDATIIASPEGKKMVPAYVIRRGHLAGSTHAVFTPAKAMVISVYHHREDFTISVNSVSIDTKTGNVNNKMIWSGNHIDRDALMHHVPAKIEFLIPAITAGIKKALCYHCREAHYIEVDRK